MSDRQSEALVRSWTGRPTRRNVLRLVCGGIGALAAATGNGDTHAQQIRTASAGNGGVATAGALGGALAVGNVNSGGNAGHALGVGDTAGDVRVSGGEVTNDTNLAAALDGGVAIADVTGGNAN